MKSLIRTSLTAGIILTAVFGVGCASREVKTETTYVPETPKVVVQPAPVVITPPAPVSNVDPSNTATSQTTTVYKSNSSDSSVYPDSENTVTTSRTHSESSTVQSVPAPPSTTTTTIVNTPPSEYRLCSLSHIQLWGREQTVRKRPLLIERYTKLRLDMNLIFF